MAESDSEDEMQLMNDNSGTQVQRRGYESDGSSIRHERIGGAEVSGARNDREAEQLAAESKIGSEFIGAWASFEKIVVPFFQELDHEYHCTLKKPLFLYFDENLSTLLQITDIDNNRPKTILEVIKLLENINNAKAKEIPFHDAADGTYKDHQQHSISYFDVYEGKVFLTEDSIKNLTPQVVSTSALVSDEATKLTQFKKSLLSIMWLHIHKICIAEEIALHVGNFFIGLISQNLKICDSVHLEYQDQNILFSLEPTVFRTYDLMAANEREAQLIAETYASEVNKLKTRSEKLQKRKQLSKYTSARRGQHELPPETNIHPRHYNPKALPP